MMFNGDKLCLTTASTPIPKSGRFLNPVWLSEPGSGRRAGPAQLWGGLRGAFYLINLNSLTSTRPKSVNLSSAGAIKGIPYISLDVGEEAT